MRIQLSVFIAWLILLSACAPATTTQTSEVLETAEVSPTQIEVAVTLARFATPEATPKAVVEFNQIPAESMGCLKNDMCMGLEVADGEAMYTQLLGAFAGSYENKAWMGGIKTAEELRSFLKTSMHADPTTGEMRPYWVPLERNDAKFMLLQGGNNGGHGLFDSKNIAIQKMGGFFLDDIAFVAASKAEIDANVGGVADWIKKMEQQNGRNVLVNTGGDIEQWGLVVVDGQLVFVGLNNGTPVDNFPQKERILGQPETKKNGQILSAYYELYIRVYSLFGNNKAKDALSNSKIESDFNKWYFPDLCVAGFGGGCEGKSPSSFSGDDALFVPRG